QGGNGIAALDATLCQRRRKLPRARIELGVAAPQGSVNDGGVVGKDRGGALQKRERGERLEICRVAIEIEVVGRPRHGPLIRSVIRIISKAPAQRQISAAL